MRRAPGGARGGRLPRARRRLTRGFETTRGAASECRAAISTEVGLFQLIGDLVDAGLGTGLVLVATRRARNPDAAEHIVTDLDRQCALRRDLVSEMERAGGGVALDARR